MSTTWVTVRGVKLARVGEWPAYRGNGKITREDLADVVAASTDQAIVGALEGPPRGWLGHVDSQEAARVRQSEPAVGRATNLRLADSGDTLLGDIEDVPENVARLYPRRSVELHPNVNVDGGRTYRKVMTGFALLGRVRGAVRGLGDLDNLLDGRPTPTLAASGEPVLLACPDEGGTEPGRADDALSGDESGRTVDSMTTPTTGPAATPAAGTTETSATGPEVERTDETPTGETPAGDETPEAGTDLAAGPETVTVTKAVWDRMNAHVDALETDSKEREKTAALAVRDTAIATALREGRIAPDDKDATVAFATKHGNDALVDYLASRPKSRAVPVVELGTSADDDPSAFGIADGEPLPPGLSLLTDHERQALTN